MHRAGYMLVYIKTAEASVRHVPSKKKKRLPCLLLEKEGKRPATKENQQTMQMPEFSYLIKALEDGKH